VNSRSRSLYAIARLSVVFPLPGCLRPWDWVLIVLSTVDR